MAEKETSTKVNQDPPEKTRSKTSIEVTPAGTFPGEVPLDQRARRSSRQALQKYKNNSRSLSRHSPDTDQLILSTKTTSRRSKTKDPLRIPYMDKPSELLEHSNMSDQLQEGGKRKSPETGSESSPTQDNSKKQQRLKSPPKPMDLQSVDGKSAPRGKTAFIKAIRPKYTWNDVKLDKCMLRKHVSEQLLQYIGSLKSH